MQTQRLGPTHWEVSRLAYGGWRLAGSEGHPLNDGGDSGTRAVLAAADAGYTLFDLADIYGDGESERIFGRALRERPGMRDEIRLVSKCSIRKAGNPSPHAPYRYDASADYIIESVEGSLKRMGVDCLDLLLLHRPDYLLDTAEVATAFDRLRQGGKVREFGVSNFRPSQLLPLQRALSRPLVTHQVQISLAHLDTLDDGTLDQCRSDGITPMAWSPLAQGSLVSPADTGLFPGSATLAAEATAYGCAISAIALAWLLRHPAGIVPVVGSTRPERIREMAQATAVTLSRESWYRLLTAARGSRLP